MAGAPRDSRAQGGAHDSPVRSAALSSQLYRVLAAATAARAGVEDHAVEGRHAVRFHGADARGDAAFIGIPVGDGGIGARGSVPDAVVIEIPAILYLLVWLDGRRQRHLNEVAI